MNQSEPFLNDAGFTPPDSGQDADQAHGRHLDGVSPEDSPQHTVRVVSVRPDSDPEHTVAFPRMAVRNSPETTPESGAQLVADDVHLSVASADKADESLRGHNLDEHTVVSPTKLPDATVVNHHQLSADALTMKEPLVRPSSRREARRAGLPIGPPPVSTLPVAAPEDDNRRYRPRPIPPAPIPQPVLTGPPPIRVAATAMPSVRASSRRLARTGLVLWPVATVASLVGLVFVVGYLLTI